MHPDILGLKKFEAYRCHRSYSRGIMQKSRVGVTNNEHKELARGDRTCLFKVSNAIRRVSEDEVRWDPLGFERHDGEERFERVIELTGW